MSHELGHRPKHQDSSSSAAPAARGARGDVALQLQQSYGNQAVRGLLAAPLQSEPQPVAPENGTGLPDDLKSSVESLSGTSLDAVNVHDNSPRPALLNALGYTHGSDISLGPGQEQHVEQEPDVMGHRALHTQQPAVEAPRRTAPMTNSVSVQRKISVATIDDGDLFEDMGGDFVAPHWRFSDAQKALFLQWTRDSFIRKFADKAALTAALTAEIAAKGVKDTAITAYNLLPRPQQTGVSANVERDILAIAQANRTSGVGYSWGAAAHQSQWSEASSSGNMMAQSFFANSFGGWSQGPGLYFAITDDPVGTVSWAKPDMINPNLMKLTFTDVPTIDITNPVCIAAIAQLAPPGAGSNTVKAQALIYGSILPILMIYGGGKVARLSTSAGVNLNVNMPSFLSTGQLQTMNQTSAMLNVKATLTALLG